MLNKSVIKRLKLTEEKNDYAYWVTQPVETRLAALESIRTEYNSWKYHDQQRFQRIYRVIEQK